MRRVLLIFSIGCLLAAPPATRRERVRVPVRLGAVSGEEAKAEAVPWRATLGGEPARVARAFGPRDGLVLLVVTDLVGDLSLVEIAKQALISGIREMPSPVWVGLLRAQDGLRVLLDPTSDREALSAAIDSVPVSGKAGLLDSVQPATSIGDAILSKAAVRVAVLFITDSDIRDYREDYTNPVINGSDRGDMSRRFPDALIRERISKIETALGTSETPVFLVHLVYRGGGLNEAYQAGLMRLISVTGGASVFCRSQSEIPDAISRTLADITSHYSVELVVPEGAPRELAVTLESDGRPLDYRTRFTN